MDDKQLLELAAKAAGYVRMEYRDNVPYVSIGWNGDDFVAWNPLISDGDALRLAVKLGFRINTICFRYDGGIGDHAEVWFPGGATPITEPHYPSSQAAATRRAIVRAAAAMGSNIKPEIDDADE